MLEHEDALLTFAKIKIVLIARFYLGIDFYRIKFYLGTSSIVIPIPNHNSNPNRHARMLEYFFAFCTLFHLKFTTF